MKVFDKSVTNMKPQITLLVKTTEGISTAAKKVNDVHNTLRILYCKKRGRKSRVAFAVILTVFYFS